MSKAMLRMSKKKVILADHTKFGQEGVMSIATPGEVDHIITDALLDKKVYPLQDFNNKITLA